MSQHELPPTKPDEQPPSPPPLIGIVLLGLGSVLALLAALNIFFKFGPPLVFGISAAVCMFIATQVLKSK
ncbi:MAG: hypothetical protein RLZZ618_903 [Pseudomonadota bacterium]|jgi:hypothetical protein